MNLYASSIRQERKGGLRWRGIVLGKKGNRVNEVLKVLKTNFEVLL